MKRPMFISGLTTALTAAIFLFFKEVAAFSCAVFGAFAFLVFVILKKKIKFSAAFTAAFISAVIFVSSVSFLAFYGFCEKPAVFYMHGEHDIKAYVSKLPEYSEDGTVTYVFKTEKAENEKTRFKFTYTSEKDEKLELYDVVSFKDASFYGASEDVFGNAYSYSEKVFLKLKGFSSFSVLFRKDKTPYYACLMFKDGCIKNMKKYLSSDSAAILSGMVFGDKSFMRAEVKNAFKASGVSHIMAVSGLHASLWCGILAAFLKLFSVSEKTKAGISLLFLVLLCTLSAFTPSVIRASLMTALVLIGPLFKRRSDSLNSLGFAVTALLIYNPYYLFAPGFLLSVLATAGVIFSTAIEIRLKIRNFKIALFGKIFAFIRSNVIVSAVSSVFTMPVCVLFFKSFCTVSPVTNILAVQPSFYAMVSGLFAAVFSFIPSPFAAKIAKVLFFIPEILLKFVKFVTFGVSKIPFSSVPADFMTIAALGLSIIIFVCLLKCFKKQKKKRTALKCVSYSLCAALVLLSLFSCFLPVSHNRQITAVSSKGRPTVVLRCGGEYAVLGAPETKSAQYEIRDYLPITKEEKLSYFAITSKNASKSAIEFIFENADVGCAVINEKSSAETKELLDSLGAFTVSASKFRLNNKIYVETVDTQGEYYAIIKDGNKSALVSLSGYNDSFSKKADILILGENEAKNFSGFCKVLVVCTKDGAEESFKNMLSNHCGRLIVLSDGESRKVK